ncbi:Protein CBG16037 [Caenorhabditis briggsae]|uniref:Protein CBG16037 n=1 Tax=Caenorhabditis briggsae TaxID=6238 RepID=A8XN86_CAEBR|nr:Protein CBG16037 [Caenorhabditis briggsae]CAP34317.2 Protein CBG16037 [Caenorhabditis briggsae]
MTENREEKKFVIKHVFEDVTKLQYDKVLYGEEEKHFGIFWKLRLCFEVFNGIPYLCVYLKFRKSEDVVGSEWSIEFEVDSDLYRDSKIKNKTHSISGTSEKVIDLIQISYINLQEYLFKGNLEAEFHVTIKKMTGIKLPKLRNFDDDVAKKFSDVYKPLLKSTKMTENREEKKFVIKHVFENVTKLQNDKVVYGNEEKHFGIFWKLRFCRRVFDDILCVCLEFRKSEDVVGSEWSIEFEVDSDFYKPHVFRNKKYLISGTSEKVICMVQINYSNLQQYLINVSLEAEFQVIIKKMTGFEIPKFRIFDDDVAKKFSDVCLLKKCLSELKTTAEIRELVPENAHDFGPDVWKELFLKAYSAL